MKFLYFTDTHIRGTTPKSRKDNLYETLKNKFKEIIKLSDDLEVDYILHGGDWFDRPDISPSIVREFAILIKQLDKPVYTVAGNHDVFGHNPDTVGRTMLGILEGIGMVHLLQTGTNVMLEKRGIKVQLTGSPYRHDIDGEDFRKYYMVHKSSGADYAINIVHGMLLQKPFYEGIQYTLINDIKETEADITFAGHYHSGFGIIESGGKYFVNTGSIVRVANSLSELRRRPGAVLARLDGGIFIKEIELQSALPGEDVLDRTELENSRDRIFKLNQFYQGISEANEFKKIDISGIIENISSNNEISLQVKEEALKRIATARERLSGGEEA